MVKHVKDNIISDKVTYKGHKDVDRSDAVEIQHPDDWFNVPLFGLERQQLIIERAISPFLKPNLSPQIQRILPRGAILYGPPGTGKTTLVKNIAKKYRIPLVIMRADRILNLYLGESEKRIAEVFKVITDFKKCIIFIDDGEALFPRRDMQNSHHTFRTMEQVLFSEIDTLNPTKTQIIIATNKIDMLDPALISRVSLTLDFENPKLPSIISLLEEYLNEIEHDERVNLSKEFIAEKLLGKDGREITSIIGSAVCNSLVANSEFLKLEDLLTALEERNIISHGDANLISDRLLIKISSDNKSLTKDKTEYNRQDAIARGRKNAYQIQRLWNKYRGKATFVSGKYPKILLKIVDFENFNGTLEELRLLVEKANNEQYSPNVFPKMMGKYKQIGLIDYNNSTPIKIDRTLLDLLAYIHELSKNEENALLILEEKLTNNQKEIEEGPKQMDYEKNIPLTEEKTVKEKPLKIRKKIKGQTKNHEDLHKMDQKDIRSFTIDDISSFFDYSKENEFIEAEKFIKNIHRDSKRLLKKREGAKSIFNGKLFFQILESLRDCEGKTGRDFCTYLAQKHKRKNYRSYQTYFLHIKNLNLVKEKNGHLILQSKAKELIKYIEKYGLKNIIERIPN